MKSTITHQYNISKVELKINHPLVYKSQLSKNSVYYISNIPYNLQFESLMFDLNVEENFKKVALLKGAFIVSQETDSFFFLAVDCCASFPLLYSINTNILQVFNIVSNLENIEIDETQVNYFLDHSHTSKNHTLLKNLYRIEAAGFIFCNKKTNTTTIGRYQLFNANLSSSNNNFPFIDELYEQMQNQFLHITKYHSDKKLIVPLTGGYDSRCILAMLINIGYKEKIITYTYGKKGSVEYITAKAITSKLQIPWHFINYTNETTDFIFSKEFENYLNQSHYYSSLPQEQDFFALKYLKESNIIPQNAVFLIGYAGGCLGGVMYANMLYRQVKTLPGNFHDCYIAEEMVKYINNGVRAFEFFGFEWYMPFCELEIFNKWFSLPYNFRVENEAWEKFVLDKVCSSLNIHQRKTYILPRWRRMLHQRLKLMLPNFIIKKVKQKNIELAKNDPNESIIIYNKIFKELKLAEADKKKFTNINKLLSHWFIKKLRNKLVLNYNH